MLSQSEGQVLVNIMNDHGLEQLVNFPKDKYFSGHSGSRSVQENNLITSFI